MVAVRTFDGTWNRGNILPRACGNAMCEVKAHQEIEKEREDGHLGFARKIGQSARSRGSSVARGKLRSYHVHILFEAQVSIDRSTRRSTSQLTQPCSEKYRKEINVGTRR